MKLGKIFTALIIVVVGLALTPTVATAASNLTYSVASSGTTAQIIPTFTSSSAAGQLVGLIPLFYVVLILGAVIGYVRFAKD